MPGLRWLLFRFRAFSFEARSFRAGDIFSRFMGQHYHDAAIRRFKEIHRGYGRAATAPIRAELSYRPAPAFTMMVGLRAEGADSRRSAVLAAAACVRAMIAA